MNKDEAQHNTAKLLKAVSYFSSMDAAALKLVAQAAIQSRKLEAWQAESDHE